MKKYIKTFCLRGLIAMGFGPLVYGVVILILHLSGINTLSDGVSIFKAILSTALVAFLVAGDTGIFEEERIGLALAAVIHGVWIYISYLLLYLVNDWIEKSFVAILIFTLIFISLYPIIWLIIYLNEKKKADKLNQHIKSKNAT